MLYKITEVVFYGTCGKAAFPPYLAEMRAGKFSDNIVYFSPRVQFQYPFFPVAKKLRHLSLTSSLCQRKMQAVSRSSGSLPLDLSMKARWKIVTERSGILLPQRAGMPC